MGNIANKLLQIAENEPRMYNAGKVMGYEQGFKAGFAEAGGSTWQEGYNVGYERGYATGTDDGAHACQETHEKLYQEGKVEGYAIGYDQGLEVGRTEGYAQGKEEGISEGQLAERNAFWEANQEGGKRTNYNYAYAFFGYDDSNFNPIYPIAPTDTNGLLNLCYSNKNITNLKVNIIVTNIGARQAFKYCSALQTVPYIEFNNCTDFYHIFEQCKSLSYIRVGGEIDKSIDFKYCPLDLESAKSVLLHLKDLYESGEQFTYSISFSDYTQALLDNDTEGWVDKDGQLLSWRNYISDIIGWSF